MYVWDPSVSNVICYQASLHGFDQAQLQTDEEPAVLETDWPGGNKVNGPVHTKWWLTEATDQCTNMSQSFST